MSGRTRLPLNALRVFEAVARHGSLAKAAEALHVQPSAVSMQMKGLADYVGTALLFKQGRQLQLTRQGAELLPDILAGLTRIDTAVKKVRDAATQRPFTLSVLPSFLHRWLLPRLPAFEEAFPGFRLQIVTGRELVDLSRGDADAAVRLGTGRWPGLKSVKLMKEWLVPVCEPKLAKQIGRLAPGELPVRQRLLHCSVDPWTLWTQQPPAAIASVVTIDDATALVAAAEASRGMALARWSLVSDAVAAGRLVCVGERIPYRYDYYWVRARSQSPAAAAGRTLRDWLRSQLDDEPNACAAKPAEG